MENYIKYIEKYSTSRRYIPGYVMELMVSHVDYLRKHSGENLDWDTCRNRVRGLLWNKTRPMPWKIGDDGKYMIARKEDTWEDC